MGEKFNTNNIPTNIETENFQDIANEFPSQNGRHPLIDVIIKGNNKPFTIGNMPECLVKIFKEHAKQNKMSLREYLVHLMKISGADVPDIRFLNPSRRLK